MQEKMSSVPEQDTCTAPPPLMVTRPRLSPFMVTGPPRAVMVGRMEPSVMVPATLKVMVSAP